MILAALPTGTLYHARNDSAGKHARDGYVVEHLEIAAYELLRRVAARAGDQETVKVAEQNLQEERRMADTIDKSWDLALDMSLKQEGVVGAPPVSAPKRMAQDARMPG
jgi:ferritin-like metal-binding protein YciE